MYIKPLSDEDKKAIGIARSENAFKKFFTANFKVLTHYAYSFLKDRHLAEDVASEIMWKIWHLESDLLHIAYVEQYILRAVKNKCLNLSRVRQIVSVTDENLENKDTRIDICCPEHILIQTESIKRINLAIEDLPPKTKQVFNFIKEDKISYKEAAVKMDISIKTVDRHVQIALNKLWEALKEK